VNLIEFKQQAGIQDNPDQEGLDLFAELIVRECADIAYSRCDTESGDDILKKFGVER